MPDPIITLLIFFAMIAITVVLFGGWLVVMMVTAVAKLIMLPLRARQREPSAAIAAESEFRCENTRCRADNPAMASFCRRCGGALRHAQRGPVRRVAMW